MRARLHVRSERSWECVIVRKYMKGKSNEGYKNLMLITWFQQQFSWNWCWNLISMTFFKKLMLKSYDYLKKCHRIFYDDGFNKFNVELTLQKPFFCKQDLNWEWFMFNVEVWNFFCFFVVRLRGKTPERFTPMGLEQPHKWTSHHTLTQNLKVQV